MNIPVQRQRVRDAKRAQSNHELPIRQELQNRDGLEARERRADDVGNSVADDDSECTHTAEGECELEERDGCAAAGAEAMMHDFDVGRTSGEFGVNDNEADCPVCNSAEDDEQKEACEEACLTDGVRETW